jgi:hypothetical protein
MGCIGPTSIRSLNLESYTTNTTHRDVVVNCGSLLPHLTCLNKQYIKARTKWELLSFLKA